MIQMLISQSMEFRPPYTHYGQIKKFQVFARFTQSLMEVFMMKPQRNTILVRKEIFRPIMCSLWLMQLLTFCRLLQAQTQHLTEAKSAEQYTTDTWGLFN